MPDIYIFKEYSMYISSIYMVYTLYIQWHLHIQGIFYVYTMYIHGIYMNIHGISCAYAPPGGWCCGGGQSPIPRISTGSTSNDIAWMNHNFDLSPFLPTLAILAPGKVDAQGAPGTENSLAWQARHANWSSSPSVIPVSEVVPKTTKIKQIASRCGCCCNKG